MTYIKDYLNKLLPLKPIPTELKPSIIKGKSYKAFIFDIYGTLLISSSGDVDEADPSTSNLNDALASCGIKHTEPDNSINTAKEFIALLYNLIKDCHKKEIEKGNSFPEVVIEDIFNDALSTFISNGKLIGENKKNTVKKLVFLFELSSNKVWPMPNMEKILHKIDKSGKPLGIVSNAQFYTPIIVNHFLNKTYEETEEITPFKNDLIQYSYKSRRGKPDISIFKSLLNTLKLNYNIKPEETVYIGNDMLKDIYTADKCNMDTVLFAGDKRSLRLRENDERFKNLEPTHIITELSQLEEII